MADDSGTSGLWDNARTEGSVSRETSCSVGTTLSLSVIFSLEEYKRVDKGVNK